MLNNLLASFLCHADTERPELIIVYLKYYSRGGFCLWKKDAEVVISKRKQKHNKFQSFFDYSESHSCIPSPLWFPKTTANLQNSMHNYKPEYARPMDMTVLPSGWYGNCKF